MLISMEVDVMFKISGSDLNYSVTDPGFFQRMDANRKNVDSQTSFPPKLHENETNWTQREGDRG